MRFKILIFLFLVVSCNQSSNQVEIPQPEEQEEKYWEQYIPQPKEVEMYSFKGKVSRVLDGDSIYVLDTLGEEHHIRLAHVDTPEYKQPYGTASREFTSDFAYGKEVTVSVEGIDKYSREISRVEVDGKELNLELVRAGLAWHYKKYSSDRRMERTELEARKKKRGLWIQENPIAPWDFRGR